MQQKIGIFYFIGAKVIPLSNSDVQSTTNVHGLCILLFYINNLLLGHIDVRSEYHGDPCRL